MTPRDFCYWLQGYFEISNTNSLSEVKLSMIKKHLTLVFEHSIDPSMGPEKHQSHLNAIHTPGSDQPVVRC